MGGFPKSRLSATSAKEGPGSRKNGSVWSYLGLLLLAAASSAEGELFNSSCHVRERLLNRRALRAIIDRRHTDPRTTSMRVARALLSAATEETPPATTRRVIVVLQGGIAERLQMLCAADAYMSSRGVPVQAVWAPDQSALQAPFRSLFRAPEGSTVQVQDTWPTDANATSLRTLAVKVRLGLQRRAGSEGGASVERTVEEDAGFVLLPFFAPKELLPSGAMPGVPANGSMALELSDEEALAMLSSLQPDRTLANKPSGTVAQCFRRLQPSKAVREHLQREDMASFFGSFGVFVERKRQGTKCPSCWEHVSVCTIRTVAEWFMRDRALVLAVVSEDPRDAFNVSKTFHETRFPLLSQTSAKRLEHGCQLWHQLAMNSGDKATRATSFASAADGEESSTLLAPLCAQLYVADLLVLGTTRGLMHTLISSPATNFILSRLPMVYDAMVTNLGIKLPASLVQLAASNTAEIRRAAMEEASSEAAFAKNVAQILASSDGGRAEDSGHSDSSTEGQDYSEAVPLRPVLAPHCICTAKPISRLANHLTAYNTIIDSELKIVYCYIEKVKCTSLKMMLRSMKHLAGLTDYVRTHSAEESGLKRLWPHYKDKGEHLELEFQGIRDMTRTDFLKIVMVRNPYTRLLSAYLDKELMGDPGGGQGTQHGRAKYNKSFFGNTFERIYGAPAPNGQYSSVPWSRLLNFSEFIDITTVRATEPPSIDRHLMNQTDLCRLDEIKYDFVGHFESSSDMASLLNLLANHTGINPWEHEHMLKKGQEFHNTKAGGKLLLYYDPETVDMVKKLYKPDFDVPLNNIHYGYPPELEGMVKSAKHGGV